MPKALECGDCGNRPHFVDGCFMGCCVAGFCENEGHKSIKEWNAYTLTRLQSSAENARTHAQRLLDKAKYIEARLFDLEQAGI